MADPEIIAAARFERDRRFEVAPKAIARGASAQEIAIDCQCWTAIAEWLDTGQFAGFYGGDDPQGETAPWVSWPELEDAANAAVGKVGAKIGSEEAFAARPRTDADGDRSALTPEQFGALRLRRHHLAVIHRKVLLRRQMIDSINAELREQRKKQAVAA